MLNTTSPTFVLPPRTLSLATPNPSSKTNLQGFWTSHGFECSTKKHFKVAFLPPPLEEKEVEYDDEADEEVFPTRPLNDDDNCWCCAQDDDMFVFQTSFFFFLRKTQKRIQKVEKSRFFCVLTTWCRVVAFFCVFLFLCGNVPTKSL